MTEWQYHHVREMLLDQSDLLVWLDLSRGRVMSQVISRTVQRSRRRTVLWNGNVEPPLRTILTNRDHIIRWAWRTHPRTAIRVQAAAEQHPNLTVVRLRSHPESQRWRVDRLQVLA